MRKYMNIAAESYSSRNGIALEDEEMVVLGDEANELETEVTGMDLPEADEMQAKSEVLEDLAVIADGIDEASPEELALIRNVSDMAVAGTDVESEELLSEEVVPLQIEISGQAGNSTDAGGSVSTESYVGRRISREGIAEIKQMAKRAWDAIIKFLKDVWVKIEKFFYNIFGTIPLLRKRIESLRKRAKVIDGDVTLVKGKDKLEIFFNIDRLSIDYTPITTAAGYTGAIGNLCKYFDEVTKFVTNISNAGEKLADTISNFKPETANDTLMDLVARTDKDATTGVKLLGLSASSGDSRWPNYDLYKSPNLIGNVVLSARIKKSKDKNPLDVVSQYQSFRAELIDGREEVPTTKKSEFEMMPLDISDILDILKEEDKLLDELEKLNRGTKLKDLIKTKNKIMSACNKAESAYSKMNEDNAAEAASLPIYRASIDFAKSYTHWVTLPMSYIKHCTGEVSAINAVVAKSLSSYKKIKD